MRRLLIKGARSVPEAKAEDNGRQISLSDKRRGAVTKQAGVVY